MRKEKNIPGKGFLCKKSRLDRDTFSKEQSGLFGGNEGMGLAVSLPHQCEGQGVYNACSIIPWVLSTRMFLWSECIIRLAVIKLKVL